MVKLKKMCMFHYRFYKNLCKNYRNQWKDIPQTSVDSLRESLKQEIESDTDGTVHKDRFVGELIHSSGSH